MDGLYFMSRNPAPLGFQLAGNPSPEAIESWTSEAFEEPDPIQTLPTQTRDCRTKRGTWTAIGIELNPGGAARVAVWKAGTWRLHMEIVTGDAEVSLRSIYLARGPDDGSSWTVLASKLLAPPIPTDPPGLNIIELEVPYSVGDPADVAYLTLALFDRNLVPNVTTTTWGVGDQAVNLIETPLVAAAVTHGTPEGQATGPRSLEGGSTSPGSQEGQSQDESA